jgi:hypothetical protein
MAEPSLLALHNFISGIDLAEFLYDVPEDGPGVAKLSPGAMGARGMVAIPVRGSRERHPQP